MTYLGRLVGFSLLLFPIFSMGCLPYIYHDRQEVLLDGLDVDQTLDVAENDLDEGGFGSILTIWAIRDQVITPEQASRISELYLDHVGSVERGRGAFFNLWHLTWAISNFYRLGSPEVRTELELAFHDAAQRVEGMDSDIATRYFSDDEIHMGDAHAFGRGYARAHLVIPGNPLYLQSVDNVD